MEYSVALPYNEMAEIAVVGAVLVHPESLNLLIEQEIEPDIFYLKRNSKMIEIILNTYKKHGFSEPQLVMEEIIKNKQVEIVVGGVDYLMKAVENASGQSSFSYYLNIVIEQDKLRTLIKTNQEIINEAKTYSGSVDEFLFEAEQKVSQVTKVFSGDSMRSGGDVALDALETLNKAIENKGEMTGLETGFKDLDYVTNGLQKSDLIILASRPSLGKSAFALNLALNVAQLNNNGNASVAFFSMEMSDVQLINRLISTLSKVDNHKIRSGAVDQEEYNSISLAVNQIQKTNLYIDDNSGTTVAHIFKECRALKQQDKLDMVVIDYLQLIESSRTRGNRQEEVSAISRQLKKLAGEMDVPVIALSQLSRKVEEREDKRPKLSDLRESGSIEQDANIVMFLHRDDYGVVGSDDEGGISESNDSETLLRISKNRNGSLKDIDLLFQKNIGKFFNVEWQG